jgi:hypothetical protein
MADSASTTWLVIILCLFLLGVWAYRNPETNRQAVELLRESLDVLKRARWILVVFLVASVASVFMEEANEAGTHFRQYPGWRAPIVSADLNLTLNLLGARETAIRWAADIIWAWPVSTWNAWLAVLFFIDCRAEIRQRLFDGEGTPDTGRRIGWCLGWLCAVAAVVVPGVTFFISWGSVKPPWATGVAIAFWAVGILASCFVVGCNAFLQCGLLQAIREAGANADTSPQSLLDIRVSTFVRVLKFCLVTALALGAVTVLVFWVRWLQPWKQIIRFYAIPVVEIAAMFALLVIVLDEVNFAEACRRTWRLWRENIQLLVALLLPLLVLAFVLALSERMGSWLVRNLPLGLPCARMVVGLARAAVSALWLVVAARLVIGRPLSNPDRLS